MATYVKNGSSWRARVRRKGITKTATFTTKARAELWAAQQELEIADGTAGMIPNKTFGDLLQRYAKDVSPTKGGERWEIVRINLFCRDEIASVNLRDFDVNHVAEWRDRRLKTVSGSSVRREWNLLSNACKIAINEWKWLLKNPFRGVRRPPAPPSRDVLYTQDEIDRLVVALSTNPNLAMGRVGIAFLFAIETGMRAGEICALTRADIDRRAAHVTGFMKGAGKTSAARREVPLSSEAIRLLSLLPSDTTTIFNLKTSQMESLFRKGKERAGIEDRTFHDTRHLACTRLSKKLNVLALARSIGHKDLKQLQIYYNESGNDIAALLD